MYGLKRGFVLMINLVTNPQHYRQDKRDEGENMRSFTIIAILIALLIAIYIVSRDMRSRLSEHKDRQQITAVAKAKEAGKNAELSNKAIRKKIREIGK